MQIRGFLLLAACCGTLVLGGCGNSSSSGSGPATPTGTSAASPTLSGYTVQHVLLISVDGLHSADLSNWISGHPTSALAQLSATGVTYSNASATTPSDSFPGLLALVTGGTPSPTGVYYDDSYDRTLFAPGSNCQGAPGTEVVYDESIDYNMDNLFSGGINPQNLPQQKTGSGTCEPVYPHSFLRVNTVFEVVHNAGGLTAWSDKHPAYDLVNGPSGSGVVDLYTPEINSKISNGGTVNGVNLAATQAGCDGTNSLPVAKVSVYTDCEPAQKAYDDVKVQAIINQIDGKNSDGTVAQAVPTLFGMNFQSVSVTEKLPVGGYTDALGTPGTLLADAISHTDDSIGRMVTELKNKGLYSSTLIIISAKHGQSPVDKTKLFMEAGGSGTATVTDPLGYVNLADAGVDQTLFTNNSTSGPTQGKQYATSGHLQTDDVGLVWLQNQSGSNIDAVVNQLLGNAASINATTPAAGSIFAANINHGAATAAIFGDPTSSDAVAYARAPNIFIQPNAGTIYSGSSKKIAEHGGGSADDTGVALLVSSPAFTTAVTINTHVNTTQVAPSILQALGLSPSQLQAVQKEGTTVLPALF